MMPPTPDFSFWDYLFGIDDVPPTIWGKIKAGLKCAAWSVFFGVMGLFIIIATSYLALILMNTVRFWPPFMSLLALAGFLKGAGLLRRKNG